jgi:hypothetical protein
MRKAAKVAVSVVKPMKYKEIAALAIVNGLPE